MAGTLVSRAIGAAMLQNEAYEEVEHDVTATSQAAVVVGIAGLMNAISALDGGVMAAGGAIVGQYIGWLVWAAITSFIGTKLFDGTADMGELLRTLGFAQAPAVLLIFAVIPFLGLLVSLAVGIWLLVAAVVAIRQALDFSTGKAVLTALIGWVCVVVIAVVIGVFTGGMTLLGGMAGA